MEKLLRRFHALQKARVRINSEIIRLKKEIAGVVKNGK